MGRKSEDRLPPDQKTPHKTAGRTMAEVLALPDALRQLVNWMLRQHTVSFDDVVAHTGQDVQTAHARLDALIEQGFVRCVDAAGAAHYQVCLGSQPRRQSSQRLWQMLDDKLGF